MSKESAKSAATTGDPDDDEDSSPDVPHEAKSKPSKDVSFDRTRSKEAEGDRSRSVAFQEEPDSTGERSGSQSPPLSALVDGEDDGEPEKWEAQTRRGRFGRMSTAEGLRGADALKAK